MNIFDLVTLYSASFVFGILLSKLLYYYRERTKNNSPWTIALTRKDQSPKDQILVQFFVNKGSYIQWTPIHQLVGEFQWWRTDNSKKWKKFGPVVSKPWELSPDIWMMQDGM